MRADVPEALPVEQGFDVTLSELAQLSGLAESELRELVDYGVFERLDSSAQTWTFSAHYVVLARKASRLRHDFELDAHSVAVLLGFVERIDALQREVLDLRAQVSTVRR
jgi:chaperone modulatory protein CbpM